MRRYEIDNTKDGSRFPVRILLAAFLLLVALPAYGGIIFFSGDTIVVPPPASLLPGVATSNTAILGFAEQQGVLLASPLNVSVTGTGIWVCCSGLDGGTIAAGTTVNSYLMYAAPNIGGSNIDYQGSITFSPGEKIIGVIVDFTDLAATDGLLGAPGTTYPPGTFRTGGLEKGDEIVISANLQTVYVNFHIAPGSDDMIRILTATPEPADFLLLGSGLIALAFFGRRLRFGRASR